jgi:hypothetical protein
MNTTRWCEHGVPVCGSGTRSRKKDLRCSSFKAGRKKGLKKLFDERDTQSDHPQKERRMEALSAKEQKKRSQDIDKMLRNEKKKMAKQTTLLMLGSGQVCPSFHPNSALNHILSSSPFTSDNPVNQTKIIR